MARVTVGEALKDLVSANGWRGAERWATEVATAIGPTLVGGSEKHGGADLGPTRARAQWLRLGVNGIGLADHGVAPGADWPENSPFKLNVRMAARIQGFPDTWKIDEVLRKTNAYKTMGNAFPPPVARAMGVAIRDALEPDWAAPERAATRRRTLPDGGAALLAIAESHGDLHALVRRHTQVGRPRSVEFGRTSPSTLHPPQQPAQLRRG